MKLQRPDRYKKDRVTGKTIPVWGLRSAAQTVGTTYRHLMMINKVGLIPEPTYGTKSRPLWTEAQLKKIRVLLDRMEKMVASPDATNERIARGVTTRMKRHW